MATLVAAAANALTILSIAAFGLGLDFLVVTRAGLCVAGAATLSLAALGALSLGPIRVLGLA
ncbi:hypothetical protein D3273_17490 [Lichenibacterium minor]|uniref:Uncharacterized protein n=1 Tax=Lichenibacterium minor TaxID=2316528 RepID=A0A4Q2U6Z8_9HYPH|nr:hypothetical protein [Lichenibacterium minor]RYC30645.1 hypothetical protein D3273_17490 [Lichenibacterium minor]